MHMKAFIFRSSVYLFSVRQLFTRSRPGANQNAHIPPLLRAYNEIHVNFLYSDSYAKSFYSAWGRGKCKTAKNINEV
jgi:hypothetical protein